MSSPILFLRTLGSTALLRDGVAVALRSKDLALLAFLAGTERVPHARSRLAGLLWGDGNERRALHSLSQAVLRVVRELGQGALTVSRLAIALRAPLPWDVDLLEAATARGSTPPLDASLSCYPGDFLPDLALASGASGFDDWADRRRMHYRMLAIRHLSEACKATAAQGEWQVTLALGMRALEIEPMLEDAHHCVIRAWIELGERSLALRHFDRLVHALRADGLEPAADTCALLAAARTSTAPGPATYPVVAPGLGAPRYPGPSDARVLAGLRSRSD